MEYWDDCFDCYEVFWDEVSWDEVYLDVGCWDEEFVDVGCCWVLGVGLCFVLR